MTTASLIPFILMIILTAVGLGISMVEHGKPKKGKNSFFISLIATIITWVLIMWMLGWRI